MEKNVWLYFNTEPDDDNVLEGGDYVNGMWPAKDLVGMTPYGDEYISFLFKSMINDSSARLDRVIVTTKTPNVQLDIIKNLTRQINNTSPTFNGFLCVADELTTKVDGTTVEPKFITDNRQDPGQISGINKLELSWLSCGDQERDPGWVNPTGNYITAAAGETALIHQGGFYNVKSANANHIIILPPTRLGTVVWLNCFNDGAGFELRAYHQENQKINENSSADDEESAIPANTDLVRCICIQGSGGALPGKWICTSWRNDGVEGAVEAAN